MLDNTPDTTSKRGLRRPMKLVLAATGAFTLLAGGSALAAESTLSRIPASQESAAQSLLGADNPSIFETETQTETQTESKTAGPVEAKEPGPVADASEPADAQGVHGACVSAVARDRSTVGRKHGTAVSEAAHSCAKGADDVPDEAKDAEKSAAKDAKDAKDAEKSAAKDAKDAEKSAAKDAKDAEKSASNDAKDAKKSAGDKSHHRG